MTKLLQWVFVVVLIMTIWLALVTDSLPLQITAKEKEVIWLMPLYLLMGFACYSLAVVGYRVATFNDCTEAAEELQQQIAEARKDLAKKGMKFS